MMKTKTLEMTNSYFWVRMTVEGIQTIIVELHYSDIPAESWNKLRDKICACKEIKDDTMVYFDYLAVNGVTDRFYSVKVGDWRKLGFSDNNIKHCLEVKCIDHNFDEGNRNVWVRDAGLDGVEDIHAGMTIDCAVCGERFEDDEGYESYYDDADGKQIEEAASWNYDWKKLGGKWYCSDCWDWVVCEIDGGVNEIIKTKDGKMFWEDDEELSPEEYKKVKIKED